MIRLWETNGSIEQIKLNYRSGIKEESCPGKSEFRNKLCERFKMQISKLVTKKHEQKKLSIELRPETAKSKTLFSAYTRGRRLDEWTEIVEELIRREGTNCYICGKNSDELHLHEFWEFNDEAQVMKLKSIHQICKFCHKIKRTDFWFFTDYGKEQLNQLDLCWEELIKHYCIVNNCSIKEFGENWREAIVKWKKQNEINWESDFGNYKPKDFTC